MHRWNFSSRARQLSGAEVLVISIPKSGRTWLRAFLCAYFCKKMGRDFTLEPERYDDVRIPRIVYSHDVFEQRTKARLWDKLRGKYLVPSRELARARVILLARDPRDAFVSLYVQLTRRTRETDETLKRKPISELLRDPDYGVDSMVDVMNSWLAEFSALPNFALVRYESLRADPTHEFRNLLQFIGESTVDEDAFTHALEFSEFGNMKKLESAGAFDLKILQPGDVRDPESFKVRRGIVGGYRESFSEDDRAYAARAMQRLDQRFGYSAEAQSRS
jgi:hypothetical protein